MERILSEEEQREMLQPWGDEIMPDGSRLEWTTGPAPPTPKWVIEAWAKAAERSGLLAKPTETVTEL
jgi:hypothetical protein